MAAELNISIRMDKIPRNKIVAGKPFMEDGEMVTPHYYRLTVGIEDESVFKPWSDYGENVKCWDWQSREERIVKRDRIWLGGGGVHWTDNKIVAAIKKTLKL